MVLQLTEYRGEEKEFVCIVHKMTFADTRIRIAVCPMSDMKSLRCVCV